jgi:chromosome partitioning protein
MAYNRWLEQIPSTYRRYVLDLADHGATTVDEDDSRLSSLKNYHSLAPLATEARKPMFALRPGDGALGAQMSAVRSCYDDFHAVTTTIANRLGIVLPVINRTAT